MNRGHVRSYWVGGTAKDLRTAVEIETDHALAGELDEFLLASLRQGLGVPRPYDPTAPVAE